MRKVTSTTSTVETGEKITLGNGTSYVVLPPCASKTNGRWACVTHSESFDNQFQKDCHIHEGKHSLTWLCNEHGPEQP